MTIALTILTAAGICYWVIQFILLRKVARAVPMLEDVVSDETGGWPRVSVIMPARDEARGLETALRSRLAEDYHDLELILVDDRSTDGTGAIADRLAAQDPRLTVIHVATLPPGWLGKQHAMQKGLELATGEWLLFSDADIEQRPGTLRRAIAHCRRNGIDHLSGLPQVYTEGLFIDAPVTVFLRLLCVIARVWAVDDPRSSAHIGSGGFNLVRRAAWDKTPGFEWLRLEPADDVALGKMMKRSGAKSSLANCRKHLAVHFYRTFGAMAGGTERVTYTSIGNFNLGRILAFEAALLLLELGVFAGLFAAGAPLVQTAAALGVLGAMGLQAWFFGLIARPRWHTLLWPLGVLESAVLGVWSGIVGAARGGIYWRGTFYPNRQLRQGRRFG